MTLPEIYSSRIVQALIAGLEIHESLISLATPWLTATLREFEEDVRENLIVNRTCPNCGSKERVEFGPRPR